MVGNGYLRKIIIKFKVGNMRIIDVTNRFKDNVLSHKIHRRRLWHWTGGDTANGAIEHLDNRMGGKGTVGYHYIIDKDGTIFILANPHTDFMQSSGLGEAYDERAIAIAFVMKDETQDITDEQIYSAKYLIKKTDEDFHITDDVHHARINRNKKDFPQWLWEDLKIKLKI